MQTCVGICFFQTVQIFSAMCLLAILFYNVHLSFHLVHYTSTHKTSKECSMGNINSKRKETHASIRKGKYHLTSHWSGSLNDRAQNILSIFACSMQTHPQLPPATSPNTGQGPQGHPKPLQNLSFQFQAGHTHNPAWDSAAFKIFPYLWQIPGINFIYQFNNDYTLLSSTQTSIMRNKWITHKGILCAFIYISQERLYSCWVILIARFAEH